MNEKERKEEEGCGQTFLFFVSDNYFSFGKKLRSNITFF